MREDFQLVNKQISIKTIAEMLMGAPDRQTKMYRYPSEKTGSVRLFEDTNTFRDYGRSVSGDVVALWAHINCVSNWQALQEIKDTFHLNGDDSSRRDLAHRIAVEQRRTAEIKQKKYIQNQLWVDKMDSLKRQLRMYEKLSESRYIPPFADIRMVIYDNIAQINGELDQLTHKGVNA